MGKYCFYENENVSLYLKDLSLIEDASSDIQSVQIYKHTNLGKVLIINKEIQHIEQWLPYYHESIVHIPMMFIKNPENILILGGGDLFAAEEVFKYKTVKNVFLCDHDKNVIQIATKYYKQANTIVNDERFHLIIDDAKNYIENCKMKFDLIIDDCFNLVEDYTDNKIFTVLKSLLSNNGICSSLIYRHIFEDVTMKKTFKRLVGNHKTVLSLVTVPEYPGILHLLTMWGNSDFLSQDLKKSLNSTHLQDATFNKKCNLFNPKFCNFYLYVPNYIKRIINERGSE